MTVRTIRYKLEMVSGDTRIKIDKSGLIHVSFSQNSRLTLRDGENFLRLANKFCSPPLNLIVDTGNLLGIDYEAGMLVLGDRLRELIGFVGVVTNGALNREMVQTFIQLTGYWHQLQLFEKEEEAYFWLSTKNECP